MSFLFSLFCCSHRDSNDQPSPARASAPVALGVATLLARLQELQQENAGLKARIEQLVQATKVPNVATYGPRSESAETPDEDIDEFWRRLAGSAGPDAPRLTHPGAGVLRKLHDEAERLGESRLTAEKGDLVRHVELVKVYLVADVSGQQRCLIERCSIEQGSGCGAGDANLMRPLGAKVHPGECWQVAMQKVLEREVKLDANWQAGLIEVDDESYHLYEEEEYSIEFPDIRTVQKVHEVHARVKPLEPRTPRPSLKNGLAGNALAAEKRGLDLIGLPAGQDFVTTEEQCCGRTRIHVWCWKSREYERTKRLELFSKHLASHGLDVHNFGVGASREEGSRRALFQLYNEVEELQESSLEVVPSTIGEGDVTLQRVVELVRIKLIADVQKRKRILSASGQCLGPSPGRFLSDDAVVEKVRPNEEWRAAAHRALSVHLGVEDEVQDACFKVDESRGEYQEEVALSDGYPGLPTLYKVRTITMDVIDSRHPDLDWIGLPAGNDFVTKEGHLGVHNGGRLNVWTWAPLAERDETHTFIGTAFEELSRALNDAEQLILQTCAHPQIAVLGLNSPLHQALGKIRQCRTKVSHIDSTLAEVDVHAMLDGEDGNNRSHSDRKPSGLADFITAQFTRQRCYTEPTEALTPKQRKPMSVSPSDEPSGQPGECSEILRVMWDNWDVWSLDMFAMNAQSNSRVVETYGQFILNPLCRNALNCGRDVTRAFCEKVASLYFANPYHNAIHAAQVCHLAGWLVRSLGIVDLQTNIERAAFSIAALCHDVKHFGRNNAFCVNTEHQMAVVYNNSRVLENMHAATTWELMQSAGGVNMTATLSRVDRAALRAQIIEYILATDMSEHFEVLSKFRVKLGHEDFSTLNAPDRCFVSRMCIKAGDVGHSCLPWDLHELWSVRVTQEFYQQGDEERNLGLPISALCDRSAFGDIGKTQKGFLEFVCLPLFEALADQESAQEDAIPEEASDQHDRVLRFCIAELKSNAKRWIEDIDETNRIKALLQS